MASVEAAEYSYDFLSENLGVSKSGFYKWKKARPTQTRKSHDEYLLVRKIEDIHTGSRKVYGSPRIHAVLKGLEPTVSKRKVERLMKKYDIRSKTKRKFKVTTYSKHKLKVAPNHLQRNFTAYVPNQVWSSDITYVPTQKGWLYLCVVMDLFSRKIVGWTLEDHMRASLVAGALESAIKQRSPDPLLTFHSDRGVQYASGEVKKVLTTHSIIPSMSRKGDCWGFRANPRPQLALGVAYLVLMILVLAASTLADDGALARWMVTGARPSVEMLQSDGFLFALVIAATLYMPVMMLMWFAPLLAAWHAMPVAKALFFSYFACMMNWRAFTVYGIASALLLIIVPFVVLFVLILASGGALRPAVMAVLFPLVFSLMPVIFASFYVSYRDIFSELGASDEPPSIRK